MKVFILGTAAFFGVTVNLCAIATAATTPAGLSVALSNETVEVDAGFAGARVILFGAVTTETAADGRPYNLSVTVTGPNVEYTVRPLRREGGIWTPGEGYVVRQAPGLFLSLFDTPAILEPLPQGVGLRSLNFADAVGRLLRDDQTSEAGPTPNEVSNALIDEATKSGLFGEFTRAIDYLDPPLFKIAIDLPPHTPVGAYAVRVILHDGAEIVAEDSQYLLVEKVGLERRIYDLAHNRPIAYGFLCVLMSLMAGWLAALAFRKS